MSFYVTDEEELVFMKTKTQMLTKGWVVALLALVCCTLWGSAFPCIKIGYSLFKISSADTGTQILFAGLRFILAGVLTIIIGSLMQKKILLPTKGSAGSIFKLCMFQTVIQYFFFYVGLAHTTGVKGAIITGTNTLIAILAASLIFHQENLTTQKMIGCLVGFAGVILANLNGSGIDFDITLSGEGFMLISATSYALSSIYLKKYSKDANPVMLSGYQFGVGGIILTMIGLVMGGRLTEVNLAGIGMLIYLAFVSAAAYSIWGILLKHNPVSKVTVYGFMNPVIGVLLSALLLHEGAQAFSLKNMIALILVAAGIYAVNSRSFKNK